MVPLEEPCRQVLPGPDHVPSLDGHEKGHVEEHVEGQHDGVHVDAEQEVPREGRVRLVARNRLKKGSDSRIKKSFSFLNSLNVCRHEANQT